MAIDMGSKTVTANVQDRTWRGEIFCQNVSDDPEIRFHRETIGFEGEVVITRSIGAMVSRRLSDVANEVRNGMTVQQLYDAWMAVADAWRQEDIEAGIETPPPGDDA